MTILTVLTAALLSAQAVEAQNPTAGNQTLPLSICVVAEDDGKDTVAVRAAFQARSVAASYFAAIVHADSLDDIRDCDVSIEFQYDAKEKTGRARAFRTHPRKLVFQAVRKEAMISAIGRGLAEDVYEQFKDSTTAAGAPGGETCAEAARALSSARSSIGIGDLKTADRTLSGLIASAGFAQLSLEDQHQAVLYAGISAIALNEFARGQSFLIRSCAMPQADGMDWLYRLTASVNGKDMSDAVLALTKLGRSWPAAIGQVGDPYIFQLIEESRNQPDDRQFELLQALYSARWKVEGRFEPGKPWVDLALLLLEKGKTGQAQEVAARVTWTYGLIGMRADRRFATLWRHGLSVAGVAKAADREIDVMRQVSLEKPRSLQTLIQLTYLLLASRRYQETLTLADDAIARSTSAAPGAPAYDDKGVIIWVMDHRARALLALGRQDEAVQQWVAAARRPEGGDVNVSQRINLANLYNGLGRPKDALESISELGELAPFGRMQMEAAKSAAALQLGDSTAAATALQYIQDHKDDAPQTVAEELVRAGKPAEAAAILIARLTNPDTRFESLMNLQDYELPPGPPLDMEWRSRWRAMIARRDVQKALAKVGKIEHYDLQPPDF